MPQSILLVDDDDNLRMLMSLILKRAGHVVHEASNAVEALAMIETSVPDLFILDVMMPGMSGFELCKQLRANPQTADRPIFVLTARADQTSMDAARDCGADRYLTKPLRSGELTAHIEETQNQRVAA